MRVSIFRTLSKLKICVMDRMQICVDNNDGQLLNKIQGRDYTSSNNNNYQNLFNAKRSEQDVIQELDAVRYYLGKLSDPQDKHKYLVALREHDVGLYYRYSSENPAEVLFTFYAAQEKNKEIFYNYLRQARNLEAISVFEELIKVRPDEKSTAQLLLPVETTRTPKYSMKVTLAKKRSTWGDQSIVQACINNDRSFSTFCTRNYGDDACNRFEAMCKQREKDRKLLCKCVKTFEDVVDYIHPGFRPYLRDRDKAFYEKAHQSAVEQLLL